MGSGRTKQMNRKARSLRIKEQRLKRQAGMLLKQGQTVESIFEAGREAGFGDGFMEGYATGLRQGQQAAQSNSSIKKARERLAHLMAAAPDLAKQALTEALQRRKAQAS